MCLACAVLQRAKERVGIAIGSQCEQCFAEYCWDGTLNTTANVYNPPLKSENATGQTIESGGNQTSVGGKISFHSTFWGVTMVSLGFILA